MRYVLAAADAAPILAIDQLGFAADPSVTRWGPGTRDVYILHYVISGRGCFNGMPVGAGEGFVITPGMQESYQPDEKSPWSFVWVISQDQRMADMLRYLHADPDTGVFRYGFIPHVRMLGEEIRAQAPGVTSGAVLLERFMGLIRRHETSARPPDERSAARRYVDFAVRYIDSSYHQPLAVSQLTELLGVSQAYLCRIFRRVKGVSPRKYISMLRLMQAKRLLVQTELPVSQVALSVGYADSLAFTRFFTSHEGISPTAYRLCAAGTKEEYQ